MPTASVTEEIKTSELDQCLERLGLNDAKEFVLSNGVGESEKLAPENLPEKLILEEHLEGLTSELQDEKVVQLLLKLNEYEELANGSFRTDFIDGFSNLSRAGFNSTRTFGPDSYDLREYQACKILVKNGNFFEVVDRLKRQREESKKTTTIEGQTSKEAPEESGTKKRTLKNSAKSAGATQKTEKGAVSTSTSISAKTEPTETREVESVKYRDPINQFGGLVPYQLRQAQSNFLAAVLHCVKLVELRRTIESLIEDIESFQRS